MSSKEETAIRLGESALAATFLLVLLMLLPGCDWSPERLERTGDDFKDLGAAVAPFLGPTGFLATLGTGLVGSILTGMAAHKRGKQAGEHMGEEKIASFNKGRKTV